MEEYLKIVTNLSTRSGSRDDDEVEEVARRSIDQLGFMLRAPLTAATSPGPSARRFGSSSPNPPPVYP